MAKDKLDLRSSSILSVKFAEVLKDYQDDYEDEIVVVTLLNYYRMCSGDEDLQWAVERVLQEFMPPNNFLEWQRARALGELAELDKEEIANN